MKQLTAEDVLSDLLRQPQIHSVSRGMHTRAVENGSRFLLPAVDQGLLKVSPVGIVLELASKEQIGILYY